MDNLNLLLGLSGLIFIIFYIARYKKSKDYQKNGIRTQGTVVEVSLFYDSRQERYYYPIVKYALQDGTWVTEKYSDGSYPSLFKKGEQVELIYKQEDPSSYIIISKTKHVDKIFLIIGVLAILFFLYHLIK